MSWNHLGLRSKALFALGLAVLLALLPALVIGYQVLQSVQTSLGKAYARNQVALSRQTMLAPVLRELALSQRLAESIVTREWLLNEADPVAKQRFFQEADNFQRAFQDHAWFLIHQRSLNYYYQQQDHPFSAEPRYQLTPNNSENTWYFNIIDSDSAYNINVNIDTHLNTSRVWLNVPVRAEGQIIGLAGTGMDLTRFVTQLIESSEKGVTPMILTADGQIQAHPDQAKIALGAGAGVGNPDLKLTRFVKPEQAETVLAALRLSYQQPEQITLVNVTLEEAQQLLAVAYIPELDWYLASAVNLNVAEFIESDVLWVMLVTAAAALALLVFALIFAVERVLIRPLMHLQHSASAIAAGCYEVNLPKAGHDEIGALVKAFSSMINTIQRHTQELESKVKERTHDLQASHQRIASINKMINDSIDYASLIQRAILPDSSLQRLFGERYFVLWRPRDTVGGDFYFAHSEGKRVLLGVVDCAGHGVPGALMTMLARAAFDHAIREAGLISPAQILTVADSLLRAMLQDFDLPKALAANMDVALVVLDLETLQLTYAGAKLAMSVCHGQHVQEIPGAKRALVARRAGDYQDTIIDHCAGQCYYLTTDGYLDQAGGALGYGLGHSGWSQALQAVGGLPLAEQGNVLAERLKTWQGAAYVQRDDVTVLGFSWPVSD
ncbi:MAG: biofilm regulation protein phosphatase SiaA [Methylococcales bacterium]|nr:biofilm regulation protein phosphatase SiaA [Methylococcales bacterium]